MKVIQPVKLQRTNNRASTFFYECTCSYCSKKFKEIRIRFPKDIDKYICLECLPKFLEKHNKNDKIIYIQHKENQDNHIFVLYHCEECLEPQIVRYDKIGKSRCNKCRVKLRKFKCSFCGKEFNRRINKYTNINNFACEECFNKIVESGFNNVNILTENNINQQGQDKLYVLSYCLDCFTPSIKLLERIDCRCNSCAAKVRDNTSRLKNHQIYGVKIQYILQKNS